MNLLFATEHPWAASRAGAVKACRALLEALAARGHRVTVLCGPARGELSSAGVGVEGGVEVHAAATLADLYAQVSHQIALEPPHAVLLLSEGPSGKIISAALDAGAAPIIHLVHAASTLPFGPQSFFPSKRVTDLLARTHARVAPSHATAAYMARWSGLWCETLPYPVFGEPPFPRLGGVDRELYTIVNPSRIKGIDIFLALARAFPERRFGAVASWATTAADREQLAQHGNVEIIEPMDSLEPVLERTRALLVPSLWHETFGLVVVEAMLRGIPVLASDVGGLPEAKLGTRFVLPVAPIEGFRDELDDRMLPQAVVPEQDVSSWCEALRALSDPEVYGREAECSRAAAHGFVQSVRIDAWEALLARLAGQPTERSQSLGHVAPGAPITRIVVAGTFAVEPLEPILAYWLGEAQVEHEITLAPYAQVFQSLLDPAGGIASNRGGHNVLCVRLADWERPGAHRTMDELVRALAHTTGSTFIVALCPSPDAAPELERSFLERLRDLPHVHVLSAADILRGQHVAAVHDPLADGLAHVCYTQQYYAALGTAIARRIHASTARPYKLVVVDADDTLWGGSCAEEGPHGVVLDEPRRALQRFLRQQREAGMLLALASKNREEDVVAVFSERAGEMDLAVSDFVAMRVGWEKKSANIRAIVDEVGIDVADAIFLDDSPVERAEVEASLPDVLTLEVPPPAELVGWLERLWVFDREHTTPEDRQRSRMITEERARQRERDRAPTLADFLTTLELCVRIAPIGDEHLDRATQLLRRTNQFNTWTRRPSVSELRSWLEHDLAGQITHVSDRFGDYGAVGVTLFGDRGDALWIEAMLLSCRALGRGVEHRMLASLAEEARARGHSRIEVVVRDTPRNAPARSFFESLDHAQVFPADGGRKFVLAAEPLRSLEYRPLSNAGGGARPGAGGGGPRASRITRLATTRRAHEIAEDVARWQSARSASPARRARAAAQRVTAEAQSTGQPPAPMDGLERALADLWGDVLGSSIDPSDDFFDQGGDSLLAVRLLSLVLDRFGVRFSLADIFDANTVRRMAAVVRERSDGSTDSRT